jgi:hypothetical protein
MLWVTPFGGGAGERAEHVAGRIMAWAFA